MSLTRSTSVKWPKGGASFPSQQLAHTDWQLRTMKSGDKSYSWWWDSHISPKNSKWLEDNLRAMDAKVKAMVKLIEEDADSFAKRAEMYYKKRPELINLVEDFYRAYRSLAERYDQLTGDIRQNVPNMKGQFGLSGDSSPGSPVSFTGRSRAAGFSVFLSPETPTRSRERYGKEAGDSTSREDERSSSSSSESEPETKSRREGQDEVQQLLMQNEQLKEDLNKGAVEQMALKEQLNKLQEDVNLLQQENSRIQEEKNNLRNEVSLGVEQVRKLKEETKHFQEAIEISEIDKDKGIALRDLLERNLEELQIQLATLQEEKRDLSDDSLRGVDQVRMLEEQLKQIQEALSSSEDERKKGMELLRQMEKRFKNSQLEFSKLQVRLNEEVSSRVDEKRDLETQVQQLQVALTSAQSEKSRGAELQEVWRKQLTDLQEELNRAREETSKLIETLEGVIHSRDEQLNHLRDEISSKEEEGRTLRGVIEAGAQEANRLEMEIQRLQSLLNNAHEENGTLAIELHESLKISTNLNERGAEMNQLIDTMKGEQAAADANRQKLEIDIDMLVKENANLKEGRLLNFNQIKRLQEELQDILSNLEEKERNILELEQELERVGQDLLYSQQEHATQIEFSETLKVKVDELKLELSRNEETNSKIVTELSSKTGLAQQLDLDGKRLQNVVRAMQEENAKSSNDLHMALIQARISEEKCLQQEQMLFQLQEEKNKLSVDLADMCIQRNEIGDLRNVLLVEKSELDDRVKELQSIISRLQEEIQQMENENEDLRKRVQDGIEEKQTLGIDIEELTDQLSSSKLHEEENISALMMEISELKIEIGRLKLDLSRCSAELKSFEEQREVWIFEKSRLLGEIDHLTEEKRGFQSTLLEWTEHKQKFEMDHMTLETRSREVEDNLLFHQAENTRVQSELSVKTEKVLMLEQELIKMQTNLSISQEEIQELSSNFEKEKQVLGNRFQAEVDKVELMVEDTQKLQVALRIAQKETETVTDACKLHVIQARTAEERCIQQEQMLLQLEEEKTKLSVDLADTCTQRNEIRDLRNVLRVQKSELDDRVKELQVIVSRLQEEIQQMRKENEDLRKRVQHGIEEKQTLEIDIQGLTDQLSSAKLNEEGNINALMMEISELKIEISTLRLELSRCSAELKSLEERREVWILEKSRLLEDINQLTEEKRGFQSTLLELTDHKQKFEMDHMTLEKRSREVEDNLLFHQAENTRVQSEISVKTEKVMMLEQELIKMQTDLSASREEMQKLSSNLEKEKQVLENRLQAEINNVRLMEEDTQKLQVALLIAQKETETVTDACKVHVQEFSVREDGMEGQITNLSNEIRLLDEESKELIRRLQDKSRQQEALEMDILQLQQALSSAQQDRQSVEADRDRQMQGLVQERGIRTRVEETYRQLQIETEGFHVEINHLQEELQRMREENQERNQHAEAAAQQQQKVELEIEKLLLALQNAQHENESFVVDEYKWHTEEVLPKRLSLRNVEEKILLLLTQRANRKRESVARTGRVKELEEELKRSGHVVEGLRGKSDILTAKYENVSKEFQVLHSQIPQLEQQIKSLEKENQKVREELLVKVKQFDETLCRLEREKTELHGKLLIEKEIVCAEILRAQVQEKEIQKLHKQLEDSESRIKTMIEDSSTLSHKYETAVKELEDLQLQFAGLQDENGRLGREVLSRTVSITELQEVVSSVEKRKIEIETEAESREEHIIVLEEKIRSLQQENDELEQKLKLGTEEARIVNEEILRLHQLHLDFQNENDSLKVDKQRTFDESSLMLIKFERVEKDLSDQQTKNAHLDTELKSGAARIEELGGETSKYQNEKQALTVEIASSAVLMNNLRTEFDSLQEEVKQLRNELKIEGEQVEKKNEEIENVNSLLEGLREQNMGLNAELQKKIQDYHDVENALNAIQEERLSLQDTNTKLSEAVASGVSLMDTLKKEGMQLLGEKEALDQQMVEKTDQIQTLHKESLMLQQSEQQLRDLLEVKDQEIQKLQVSSFNITQEKEKLETELKLCLYRCGALENLFKSLQQDLIERTEQKSKPNAVSSFIDKLTGEVVQLKERLGLLQDGLTTKQGEIDGIHRKNEELHDGVRKREDEVRNLREQLRVVREEHGSLQEELLTKVWFLQKFELSFKSLKETKLVFEGGTAVEIGDVDTAQEEVTKLVQKVTKLNELLRISEEKVEKMEENVYKLQIGNRNLREDVLGLRDKEKSYVIAVRFMRAEFSCLVQRVKMLRDEKEEQARQIQGLVEGEKKKGADLSNLQGEVGSVRDEVKRQKVMIVDRDEEKREAIRQLCLALEFSQDNNLRLEEVIRSVRLRIQQGGGGGGCRCCGCLPV